MEDMRDIYFGQKPEWRRPLGRPWRGWRIIIKWILRKYFWRAWIGFMYLRIRTSGGLLFTQ
jgi:hypothetical protein